LGRVATPVFDPPSDTLFSSNLIVTILCGTPGAEMHYTLDNTDPGLSSLEYAFPILITNNTTMRVRAWKEGMLVSKSAAATYAMVRFVPADFRETPELVNFETSWRFNQTDNLDGVNWTGPDYDDSAWPSGLQLFSYPETDFTPTNTVLGLGRNTYYFRTHFNFTPADPSAIMLVSSNFIDDGAVFYLNGRELGRHNMRSGPISYDSVAVEPINGPPDWKTISLPGADLRTGDNALAVEVHQWGPASTDIYFATYLHAVITYPQVLQISKSGADLIVTWQLNGVQLEQSTAIDGPWQTITPRPLSPYHVPTDGSAQFFRAALPR
jgi:hypothetical protein